MSAATCHSCRAEIVWATMPSGTLMPLDVLEVAERERVPGVVALRPELRRGKVLVGAEVDAPGLLDGWAAKGVSFHRSHFSTCPGASAHRRRDARPGQESLL